MRQIVACSTLATLVLVAAWCPQCDAGAGLARSHGFPHDDAWFTCDGGCATVLGNAIGLARKSIVVEGYRIGPEPLLGTLRKAEAAGVRIRMISERCSSRYPGVMAPKGSMAELRDPDYALDRPEVIVIDNRQVIKVFFGPGSDHHRSVTRLFVTQDPDLAAAYTDSSGAL